MSSTEPPRPAASFPETKKPPVYVVLYGVGLALVIAIPSWFAGRAVPVVGGPVFAILIGIVVASVKRPAVFDSGIAFCGKKVLQYSIVFLGFALNLGVVLRVGSQSLLVMVFTLAAAFLVAALAGRALGVNRNAKVLIGVGTAICGGSAIAAAAPVIDADGQEISCSISTIFLFNILAVFMFPSLGHLLGMTDAGFGMWAGTAINDTSSVVAAGFAFSDAAGQSATIVKLTRTLMIIPVTLGLAFWMARASRREAAAEGVRSSYSLKRIFPWFVLGFLAASLVCTSGIISVGVSAHLSDVGKFGIVTAMAAIGLNTKLRRLIANGLRPIILGLACWFAVAAVSLIVQFMLGTL